MDILNIIKGTKVFIEKHEPGDVKSMKRNTSDMAKPNKGTSISKTESSKTGYCKDVCKQYCIKRLFSGNIECIELCASATEMLDRTMMRSKRNIILALSILVYLMKVGKPLRYTELYRAVCELDDSRFYSVLYTLVRHNIVKVSTRVEHARYKHAPLVLRRYYFVGNPEEMLIH